MPVSRTSTTSAQRSADSRAAGRRRPETVSSTSPELGELDGVRQQVDDDLPEAALVADDRPRQAVVDRVGQLEVLRGRQRARRRRARLRCTAAKIERSMLELDLAGLDLREVEDVVDDQQQGIAGRPDRLGVVALLVVERGVEDQPAHPDDRVHRRPDLVAHRREERRLGLVGLLRRTPAPPALPRTAARSRSRWRPAARGRRGRPGPRR